MPLPDIRLQRNYRGLVIGQSGSGKTLFCIALLRRGTNPSYGDPVIIFDTKNDPDIEKYFDPYTTHYTTASGVLDGIDQGMQTTIVRPTGEEMADLSSLDMALDKIYNHGSVVLYIDEIGQIQKSPQRMEPGLANILTRGRSRHVTTLGGIQRPAHIARSWFSEARQYYVFFLSDQKDRKRVREFIPDDRVLQGLQRHQFWYYESSMERAQGFNPITPPTPWTPKDVPEVRREKFKLIR